MKNYKCVHRTKNGLLVTGMLLYYKVRAVNKGYKVTLNKNTLILTKWGKMQGIHAKPKQNFESSLGNKYELVSLNKRNTKAICNNTKTSEQVKFKFNQKTGVYERLEKEFGFKPARSVDDEIRSMFKIFMEDEVTARIKEKEHMIVPNEKWDGTKKKSEVLEYLEEEKTEEVSEEDLVAKRLEDLGYV